MQRLLLLLLMGCLFNESRSINFELCELCGCYSSLANCFNINIGNTGILPRITVKNIDTIIIGHGLNHTISKDDRFIHIENIMDRFDWVKNLISRIRIVGNMPSSGFGNNRTTISKYLNLVQQLEIISTDIVTFPGNIDFDLFDNLQIMSMINNVHLTSITSIPYMSMHTFYLEKSSVNSIQDIFSNNYAKLLFNYLTEIRITHSLLTKISNNCFGSAPFVQHIDLSNNKIDTIDSKAFKNLRRLLSLNLRNNQLKELDFKKTFFSAPNLRSLYLQDNKITQANFTGMCKHLNYIFLQNNELTSFPYFNWIKCNDLKYIYVSNSKLTSKNKLCILNMLYFFVTDVEICPRTKLTSIIRPKQLNVSKNIKRKFSNKRTKLIQNIAFNIGVFFFCLALLSPYVYFLFDTIKSDYFFKETYPVVDEIKKPTCESVKQIEIADKMSVAKSMLSYSPPKYNEIENSDEEATVAPESTQVKPKIKSSPNTKRKVTHRKNTIDGTAKQQIKSKTTSIASKFPDSEKSKLRSPGTSISKTRKKTMHSIEPLSPKKLEINHDASDKSTSSGEKIVSKKKSSLRPTRKVKRGRKKNTSIRKVRSSKNKIRKRTKRIPKDIVEITTKTSLSNSSSSNSSSSSTNSSSSEPDKINFLGVPHSRRSNLSTISKDITMESSSIVPDISNAADQKDRSTLDISKGNQSPNRKVARKSSKMKKKHDTSINEIVNKSTSSKALSPKVKKRKSKVKRQNTKLTKKTIKKSVLKNLNLENEDAASLLSSTLMSNKSARLAGEEINYQIKTENKMEKLTEPMMKTDEELPATNVSAESSSSSSSSSESDT